MTKVSPGPSSIIGLKWLASVGPSPMGAWGVAMGWSRVATYSHAQRLRRVGWVAIRERPRGEGSLVYATPTGTRSCAAQAAVIQRSPSAVSWPHCDASAWTAAWLSSRGRPVIGAREMLFRREFRGDLKWRERGQLKQLGHRPDLGGWLPDGRIFPIEVELTHKSPARLDAVLSLHAAWVAAAPSPAVMYVCATPELARRVREAGAKAGLASERGTLRVELLDKIKREAIEASAITLTDWHLSASAA
jgi:hypothetical protein